MPAPETLAFAVLVVVLLWFAIGTQRNIRRGNDVLRWLQGGLPLIGRRTTLRWLGSTAVRLNIQQAAGPLAEAEVVVVLEPRDLGWLWLWSRRRGRRDTLILRARMRSAPRFELEAGDARGWTGSDRLKRLDWGAWRRADWGEGSVTVAHTADADLEGARALWMRYRSPEALLWRMSVRREHPHVELHFRLPDIAAADARRFVGALVETARLAGPKG